MCFDHEIRFLISDLDDNQVSGQHFCTIFRMLSSRMSNIMKTFFPSLLSPQGVLWYIKVLIKPKQARREVQFFARVTYNVLFLYQNHISICYVLSYVLYVCGGGWREFGALPWGDALLLNFIAFLFVHCFSMICIDPYWSPRFLHRF